MYTNNDFERLFIRYKAEGLPNNESIEHFWDRYGEITFKHPIP